MSGHVTVVGNIAYLNGKVVGVVVPRKVEGSIPYRIGKDTFNIVVAKDSEEFEQVAMYEWRQAMKQRAFDIQKKYNKGDNEAYEHVLKPLEDWME